MSASPPTSSEKVAANTPTLPERLTVRRTTTHDQVIIESAVSSEVRRAYVAVIADLTVDAPDGDAFAAAIVHRYNVHAELLAALERVRHAFYVEGSSKALRAAFEGTKELVAAARGESNRREAAKAGPK